jgi:hypothetical protein
VILPPSNAATTARFDVCKSEQIRATLFLHRGSS